MSYFILVNFDMTLIFNKFDHSTPHQLKTFFNKFNILDYFASFRPLIIPLPLSVPFGQWFYRLHAIWSYIYWSCQKSSFINQNQLYCLQLRRLVCFHRHNLRPILNSPLRSIHLHCPNTTLLVVYTTATITLQFIFGISRI